MAMGNKRNIGVAILLLAVCLFGLHYGVEKVFNLLLQRFQARFFWGCLLQVFCCSCCSCCCCSCVWNTILWQIKYTNEACTSTRMHTLTHTNARIQPRSVRRAACNENLSEAAEARVREAFKPCNYDGTYVYVCVWDGNCCALCVWLCAFMYIWLCVCANIYFELLLLFAYTRKINEKLLIAAEKPNPSICVESRPEDRLEHLIW